MFPLRGSYFEGVPVKIPYAYADLLVEEYGARSLSNTEFHEHQFNENSKIWEGMKSVYWKYAHDHYSPADYVIDRG